MKILLKNCKIINVFTSKIEEKNVLIEDEKIIGVGNYYNNQDADIVEDLNGSYICPGFIDGHIHIESTTLSPYEFAKATIPHGTTAVVADPHEIANVCGTNGIDYFLQATENLPLTFYCMIPSCVPATKHDESYMELTAKDIEKYYKHKRVLGLAEMMNYPGVVYKDSSVIEKINSANKNNVKINGHAPMLTGKDLDTYISSGISDDHECSNYTEALEKLEKGQWIMIREGTAAKNLNNLIDLFNEPYCNRCLLVTDDKHPADIIENGHIDNIINKAITLGKSAITGIKMATLNAAQCFNLKNIGAIAPGYIANINVFDNLNNIKIKKVYKNGKKIFDSKLICKIQEPKIDNKLLTAVSNSINIDNVKPSDFNITPKTNKCRVIEIIPEQLITNEAIETLNFNVNNGIDIEKDILKIAVVERHHNTHHIGLGYIKGIGIKTGALASSVSHDSHNIIAIGTNDEDIALAVNTIKQIGGGMAVVDKEVKATMPLPIAGLMGKEDAKTMAELNQKVRLASHKLGASQKIEPFMNMSFVSLPVIPNLKITTLGLIDVNKQQQLPLFV